MKYELRDYQTEAVDSVWSYLRTASGNPCLDMPVGSGKSIVIAELARQAVTKWNGRVLVLAHIKELLVQNHEKIVSLLPEIDVGLYSAGLKKRQTTQQIIVAGIQSVYKRACELDKFNIIIIDEIHLLSNKKQGMYNKFIADALIVNPKIRIIGLTGSPYRLDQGNICGPDNMMTKIVYQLGLREMIQRGYLCEIASKASIHAMDTEKLHRKMGEFIDAEMLEELDSEEVIKGSCEEIVEYAENRKAVLIFCINVSHAEHVRDRLRMITFDRVELITGTTKHDVRDALLIDFKSNDIKYMVNVSVLTTGFDNPSIDMVCLLRATTSPSLMLQMCGRGLRIAPNKQDCLIMDFGQNIQRLGTLDNLQIKQKGEKKKDSKPMTKVCPNCNEIIHLSYTKCPACGFLFTSETLNHGSRANLENIMSDEIKQEDEFEVESVEYAIHKKKTQDGVSRSLRVTYILLGDLVEPISEWICLEHEGYALKRAHSWWKQFSVDQPDNPPIRIEQAIEDNNSGLLLEPKYIKVSKKPTDKYWSVIGYKF